MVLPATSPASTYRIRLPSLGLTFYKIPKIKVVQIFPVTFPICQRNSHQNDRQTHWQIERYYARALQYFILMLIKILVASSLSRGYSRSILGPPPVRTCDRNV